MHGNGLRPLGRLRGKVLAELRDARTLLRRSPEGHGVSVLWGRCSTNKLQLVQDCMSAYTVLMQETVVPLRERHRAETWGAIRNAAGDLAMEAGLSGATIDAITARAGVSRRTFFNYFQTKEDAVLGTQSPTVPDDAIAAFDDSAESDLFTRTVRLLAEVALTTVRNDSGLVRRRELAKRFPELRVRLSQLVTGAEQLVEALLEERVATGQLVLSDTELEPADAIHALLVLAGATLRFVYARNPALASAPSGPELDSAIALFRTVMKEAT